MARALWLIPGIYALLVTGEFLAMTQLALALTARGASALAVGVLASSFWLGILAASLRAERVIARLGHSRSFIAAMGVSTAAFGVLAFQDGYVGWLVGVVAMGLAGGVLWVNGEAWLAEASPAARRGFYVGLFQTAVGIGLVGGPALLTLLQRGPLPPLAVALALAVVALGAAVMGLRGQDPPAHRSASPAGEVAAHAADGARRAAWPLVGVATIAGVLEVGSGALLPSISMRLAANAEAAAWLGALIGLGSALLPTPSGLLADRLGLRRVMNGGWLLIVVATLVLAVVSATRGAAAAPLLWPVGFVLGGMGATIYTLVVIDFGQRFTGPALLRVMALLVTGYTAGTSLGPAVGGALFDAAGLPGLAAGLFACSVAGSLLAWRTTRARPGGAAFAQGLSR